MASTLVACALRYDRPPSACGRFAVLSHPARRAAQLTRDHTVANEQVKLGLISANEAADSSTRHVLSRCLGIELIVAAETSEHQVFVTTSCCCAPMDCTFRHSVRWRLWRAAGRFDGRGTKAYRYCEPTDGGDNISVQLIRFEVWNAWHVPRASLSASLIRLTANFFVPCTLARIPVRPGEQLDHYRIDSLAARSGMASIFVERTSRTAARRIKSPPEMETIRFY